MLNATLQNEVPTPALAVHPGFHIFGPIGKEILIPRDVTEDLPYFSIGQESLIRDYYGQNGYVVIRDVIPRQLCDEARKTFEQEVKPYRGFIYRQATGRPERHVFTPNNFLLNSILNIQSLPCRRFSKFRSTGLEIITHRNIQRACEIIFGEPGTLVQSIYFEGNPVTWAHQDTYYLDAEHVGRMAAAWVAVEDIAPGAGRFYIYPRSHLIDIAKNGGEFDIAFNHDRYKRLVLELIERCGVTCRAPALRKGDVLLWSGKTIHGSLETRQPQYSRNSITAHYIPASMRFLQHQSRIKRLQLESINGMRVNLPKDLNKLRNRVVFWVETTFPEAFFFAKKFAIKAITR